MRSREHTNERLTSTRVRNLIQIYFPRAANKKRLVKVTAGPDQSHAGSGGRLTLPRLLMWQTMWRVVSTSFTLKLVTAGYRLSSKGSALSNQSTGSCPPSTHATIRRGFALKAIYIYYVGNSERALRALKQSQI